MDKQEPISENTFKLFSALDKISGFIGLIANVFIYVLLTCTVLGVIALLYVNDFQGFAIILYKLGSLVLTSLVVYVVVYYYFKFIKYIYLKEQAKNLIKRAKFKQELKQEIVKEMRNGKRR